MPKHTLPKSNTILSSGSDCKTILRKHHGTKLRRLWKMTNEAASLPWEGENIEEKEAHHFGCCSLASLNNSFSPPCAEHTIWRSGMTAACRDWKLTKQNVG